MKVCCAIGLCKQDFIWDYDKSSYTKEYRNDMKIDLRDYIKNGFDYFICNGEIGVGMDFAQAVLNAKRNNKNLKLEISVPYKNQELNWSDSEKKRYRHILKNADTVNILFEKYSLDCNQKNYEYMIDKSDLLYVVDSRFDEMQAIIEYAKLKNKKYRSACLRHIIIGYLENYDNAAQPVETIYTGLKTEQIVYIYNSIKQYN